MSRFQEAFQHLATELGVAELVRLLAAVLIGALIGGERQYRGKAAGFRTMTLICVGATVLTILSQKLGAGTRKVVRDADKVSCWYDVRGHHTVLAELGELLVNSQDLSAVECTAQGVGRSDGAGGETA